MKKFKVRVFTEEYSVEVRIGKREEVCKSAARYLGVSTKAVINDFAKCRGMAWNGLDPAYSKNGRKHPIIIVDGDEPAHKALATLAHEASHAMDFIQHYISMNDRSGEFHAHGIAAIMRTCGLAILGNKARKSVGRGPRSKTSSRT